MADAVIEAKQGVDAVAAAHAEANAEAAEEAKEKETVEEVVEEAAAPLTKEEALDKAIAEAEANNRRISDIWQHSPVKTLWICALARAQV